MIYAFRFIEDYSGDIKDDLVDPGNCVTLCCGDCHAKQNNMLVGRNCDAADADIVGRCGMNFISTIYYIYKDLVLS